MEKLQHLAAAWPGTSDFCVTIEGKNESTIGLTLFYSALYFSPEMVQLISTYSPLAKDDCIFHIIAKKAEKQVFL